MTWKPMNDNQFPWPHKNVIIAAFNKHDPNDIELIRCHCTEHGAYFPENTTMLSIIEQGWIPFAFKDDDTPDRDDVIFPPMWTDYLTDKREL